MLDFGICTNDVYYANIMIMNSSEVSYEIYTTSRRGPDKARNGDCVSNTLLEEDQALALVVCDGVGSHAYDWRASETACRSVIGALQSGSGNLNRRMAEAVQIAHGDVQELEGAARGATTTMVLVVWRIGDDHCRFVSIGDSRLYRLSVDGVEKLTQDDTCSKPATIAGELVLCSGAVRFAHALTRAVGYGVLGDVTVLTAPLLEGDMLIAVTDGCHELPGIDQIFRHIFERNDLESAVFESLIKAHQSEGRDDATTAMVRRINIDEPTLQRCRRLVRSGTSAINPPVPKHILQRAGLIFLREAAESRDSAGMLEVLDYLDEQHILIQKKEIAILLDTIEEDGTQETRRAFRRLATLLALSK
ncbi:MAG: protein phosphatase 2C domain-containing protein [bacterium]|nr:protein phosphatase 2C domain-containing protein [bacterium]